MNSFQTTNYLRKPRDAVAWKYDIKMDAAEIKCFVSLNVMELAQVRNKQQYLALLILRILILQTSLNVANFCYITSPFVCVCVCVCACVCVCVCVRAYIYIYICQPASSSQPTI
jgi:hypothetical protein